MFSFQKIGWMRALQAYTLAGKAAVMYSVVFPELFFFENCTAVEEAHGF
jgi:hypothetical protein